MGGPVVATRSGKVRGIELDGCVAFIGVRYGAAPVGALRFRPPVPPEPWRGVVDASAPAPIAPQMTSAIGGYVPGDPLEQDEDCLFLNVFTPACDDGRRPVLVFVHGGAFLVGTGSGVLYRGEHLARRGLVVVTANYRLGALGFVAHEDLVEPGGALGNYGLRDQVAVLEWVRDHIAAFGGDPGVVTIAGESAGAMSVGDLLTAPTAKGLFRRAVMESGSTVATGRGRARTTAIRFAEELGLAHDRIASLRDVPADELVAAQSGLVGEIGVDASMPFQPVVDGIFLPRPPGEVLATEPGWAESLLLGSNRDEFRLFTIGRGDLDAIDDDVLHELITAYLPSAADADDARFLAERYRALRMGRGAVATERALFEAIAGDAVFRIPIMRLATAQSAWRAVYAYRFDWESPFSGGTLGACHALELPFVFGTLDNPVIGLFAGAGPAADALSDTMQRAWSAFATSGDPATADLEWPRYTASARATLVLGPKVQLVDAPEDEERVTWEGLFSRWSPGRDAVGADASNAGSGT